MFGDSETLYAVVEHSQRQSSNNGLPVTCLQLECVLCLLGVGEGGQGFLFQCFQCDDAGTEELHGPWVNVCGMSASAISQGWSILLDSRDGGRVFQTCSPIIHWSWGHTDGGNSARATPGDSSIYHQCADSAPASSWTLLRKNHSPVGKGTVKGYNWVVFLGYSTFLLDHKPYQLPTGRGSPFAPPLPPAKKK